MEKEARLVQLLALVLGCAGQHVRRPNNVSLLPQNPLIHLGDPVQFNCSMNCPNALYTWKGLDTKSGTVTSASHYSLLSIVSTAVHNEGRIICEGACQGRRIQKTSQLNLYSLPDTMQLAQHPAHILCSIRRVYPPDALVLSWYQGERKLHTEVQQDISDADDEKDEVQSYQLRLDLSEGMAMRGTTYRCEAELHLNGATIQRNKTIIFSTPDGPTAAINKASYEEQPMMEMPIPIDTSSTKSATAPESTTLAVNLGTPTSTTTANPTTEGATTRVNPTTDTATTRVNPSTDTATTKMNPTTDTATARVNPSTDTATTGINPTSETAAMSAIPTSETVKNKEHPIPGMYGIRDNRLYEINQAVGDDINDTSNPRLKPITAKELYAITVSDPNSRQTATVTISRWANPTRPAPPKPGVNTESVAIWSVLSVWGLLSSCIGLHQLWKRLNFMNPKKGSFNLLQV